MGETTGDRVARLLALVAYLREHPAVPVAAVAAQFGTTEAQVLADVNLLWVAGTPGYLPDDLIDFSAEALDHGVLTLTDARGMDRPLRLSSPEALSLLVALRTLRDVVADAPALAELDALDSAIEKLSDATGDAAARAGTVQVRVRAEVPAETVEAVRRGIDEGRRLRLRYVSAADVVTERDVDPVELRSDGTTWSLRGWCQRAQGPRTFRLDRVLALEILDVVAAHHPDLVGPEPWARTGEAVTLELASRARWVAEHTPVEDVVDLPDGDLRIQLRVNDPAWLENLVLSLGDAVRSVEPPTVAARVAGAARAALDAYTQLDRLS